MAELGIHREAEQELETAFDYLEDERPGHGFEMLDRYRELVEQIIAHPAAGTPVLGYSKQHDVRKFHMQQFSYALIVATARGQRIIVAVAHHKRQEHYWRERLK
jgi:plasmid stabilization system protein ParE